MFISSQVPFPTSTKKKQERERKKESEHNGGTDRGEIETSRTEAFTRPYAVVRYECEEPLY